MAKLDPEEKRRIALNLYSERHPKFLCQCKHTGDGANSDHTGEIGHGGCRLCLCTKFTWKE